MSDFIPTKEADFFAFAETFTTATGTYVELLGIPMATFSAQRAAFIAYEAAYQICLAPNAGKIDREKRAETRETLTLSIRRIKKAYIDGDPNGVVTNAIREAFGLPPRDPVHTPDTKPKTIPEAEADSSVIRRIAIHFKDRGAKSRAKPHGVHGAEIRWSLLDHPPADIEADLIHSEFDTRTPFTLVFKEEERGRRIYFALRWESPTNLKGDWSEIYDTIIP